MSSNREMLLRVAVAAFLATAMFLLSACATSGNGDPCSKCIYLDGKTVKFDAYHIGPGPDTTFYSIELISSSSRFLAQRKLNYIVSRFNERNRITKNLTSESTTGFFEDSTRIWLHPPRVDKFKKVTQLAPYPEINFPIRIGDTITGKINMAFNWGDWNGHSSKYYLTVVDSFLLPDLRETMYTLQGCGSILNEISCVEYHFSTTRGFVKASYLYNKKEFFYMEQKL